MVGEDRRPDREADGGFIAADLVWIGAWLGLASGLIEVGIVTVEHVTVHPIMELSRDYVWLTPLAGLLLVGTPALVLAAIGHRWRLALRIGLFLALTLAVLALLLLIPRLADVACLVLALGIATRLLVWIVRRPATTRRLVRRTLPGLALLVLLLGTGVRGRRALETRRGLAALPPPPAEAINVLLITLDTVRAASLSLYGHERSTTPNLERYAARGAVFEHAFSAAPWTLPSHASLLTGRWPHELSASYGMPLDDSSGTLAELLRDRGYETVGFVANMRYCGYESGLDRGFLRYDDYDVSLGRLLESSALARAVFDNFRLRRLVRDDQHLGRKSADELNEEVFEWLADRPADRPFFAFLNYFDAHEPYLPPAPFDTRFGDGRAEGRLSPLHHWLWDPAVRHAELTPEEIREERFAYEGAIAYLDDRIDRLLARLEELGEADRTLVVITADHGEEFGEHGVFEHGYSLYRPSIEVPLVIVLPGSVPADARYAEPVSLRDVPATIGDLLGIAGGGGLPGRSLAAAWEESRGGAAPTPIVSELDYASGQPDWFPVSRGDMRSLIDEGAHYIRSGDGREELYDLADDPWETRDLAPGPAAGPSPRLASLRARLEQALGHESRARGAATRPGGSEP